MTASRGIVPPPIPASHTPLPSVYLVEMTTIRGRRWWASLPDYCGNCASVGKSSRLFLDPPVDLRDSGRVYCQACSREAATVQVRRPEHQRARAYDDMRQGVPRLAGRSDTHATMPCKGGCGREVQTRKRTGLCKACYGSQAPNLRRNDRVAS